MFEDVRTLYDLHHPPVEELVIFPRSGPLPSHQKNAMGRGMDLNTETKVSNGQGPTSGVKNAFAANMATVSTNIVEHGFNQGLFNKWQNDFNKSQVCSRTFDFDAPDFFRAEERWYRALSLPIRPCSVFPTVRTSILSMVVIQVPEDTQGQQSNGLGKTTYVATQGSRTTIIMLNMFPSSTLYHFTTMFLLVRMYTWGVPNPHLMIHSKLPRLHPHLGCKLLFCKFRSWMNKSINLPFSPKHSPQERQMNESIVYFVTMHNATFVLQL